MRVLAARAMVRHTMLAFALLQLGARAQESCERWLIKGKKSANKFLARPEPQAGPQRLRFLKQVKHMSATAPCSGYDRIEILARALSDAIRERHKGFAHGMWGVFAADYAQSKASFMYKAICAAAARGQLRAAPTVCEVGFMAGHTSLLFLLALPSARVVSFDLGDTPWAAEQGRLLQQAFGPERFDVTFGLSNETLPQYHMDHPALRCDVVFVDGDKCPDARLDDFLHLRAMATGGALVLFDEATTFECVAGLVPEQKCGWEWDGAPKAFNRASRRNLLRVTNCSRNPAPLRGRWQGYAGVRDNVCAADLL